MFDTQCRVLGVIMEHNCMSVISETLGVDLQTSYITNLLALYKQDCNLSCLGSALMPIWMLGLKTRDDEAQDITSTHAATYRSHHASSE